MLKTLNNRAELLSVQACVLAENATDITLAVTMPKAVVRDQVGFLSAVMEAGLGAAAPRPVDNGDDRPARRPARALVALPKALGWIMAATVAVAMLAVDSGALRSKPQPPLTVSDWHIDPVVRLGDPVVYRFISQRTRICATTIDRVALDQRRLMVDSVRQYGSHRGYQDRPEPMEIPVFFRNLTLGKYFLRVDVHDDCGRDDVHPLVSPDMPFEVVAKE